MNLQKTIEIIDLNIKEAHKNIPPDVKSALQLSVEAMKRIQAGRVAGHILWEDLLPGETQE